MSTSLEINCEACGKITLLLREPVYEGFQKTGELLKCTSCGHVYDSEDAVPFIHQQELNVFSDEDRSAPVEVFREDEKGRLCRYCKHYVVNPFTQWCGRHLKEVQATDTCPDFTPGPSESETENAPI